MLYMTRFHPTTPGLHQVWGRNEIQHLIFVLRSSMHMLRQGYSLSMLHRTTKNLLVSPKDKDPMANKSGPIYWFQCGDLKCDDEYIQETFRTFGERFKEHLKEPSPINHDSISTGHPTTQHNFQIIGREGHDIARTIKESIYIRVNNRTLNRNIGKLNLHHIGDRVLLYSPGLKLKWHAQGIGHAQNTQPNSPNH